MEKEDIHSQREHTIQSANVTSTNDKQRKEDDLIKNKSKLIENIR